ncbi:MAG: ATP-binding cassette domain-containing protein [Acidobacteria bacterium]|nr:ATP-binding cassette domain-containing protein [Acidobacteriota bacterium]
MTSPAAHDDDILGKAYDARLMRRLLAYLAPYWRQVLVAVGAITVGAAVSLAQPYLVKVAIDRHVATGQLDGLGRLAGLYCVLLVAAFAAEYLQTWTMQLTGQRIMFDLRMAIYGHLQRLDVRYFDRNPVGRLMTRVTSDVDVLNELFTSGVVTIFSDVFALVGIMAVLLWMDWRLALVTFLVLPLIAVVAQWFRTNVRESYRVVRGWIARINAFLQENITGMSTVQLFGRQALNFKRFDDIDAKHRDANIAGIFYYAVFYPAIEAIAALSTALIIWYGGLSVIDGTLTIGALVAFVQYSQRFFRPISDMSEKFNVLQAAMASSERIFKVLDEPVLIESPRPAVARPGTGGGHIVFDRVWFAYNDEQWVLRDVSFEVKPGERVGIVGATGSGKTTLINLLLRFYDVQRGRITIDGVDVRDLELAELRGLFSLVLQDVHLFSGTIADNIRLGNPSIDEAAVRRAAAAVHADAFIERLAGGYDARVAERGATLSVGQKQLISFARALAFDPRVLVLDEATSSVDTETELLIREALHVLMAGRTTMAIAHRLSTIQDMDKILVLHKGALREAGTHQELLAARGIYFKLFELQYEGGAASATPSVTGAPDRAAWSPSAAHRAVHPGESLPARAPEAPALHPAGRAVPDRGAGPSPTGLGTAVADVTAAEDRASPQQQAPVLDV